VLGHRLLDLRQLESGPVPAALGILMATSDSIPTVGHSLQLDAHQIFQHESLRTQRQPSGSSSTSSTNAAMRGKRKSLNRRMARSSPSRNTQSSTSTHAENRASQRDVRTLPRKLSSCFGKNVMHCPPRSLVEAGCHNSIRISRTYST
jgi:hypothetical protein